MTLAIAALSLSLAPALSFIIGALVVCQLKRCDQVRGISDV
jgi:hypothetical protein